DVPTSSTPIFAARPSHADSAPAGWTAGPTATPMARTLAGETRAGGAATEAISPDSAPAACAGCVEGRGATLAVFANATPPDPPAAIVAGDVAPEFGGPAVSSAGREAGIVRVAVAGLGGAKTGRLATSAGSSTGGGGEAAATGLASAGRLTVGSSGLGGIIGLGANRFGMGWSVSEVGAKGVRRSRMVPPSASRTVVSTISGCVAPIEPVTSGGP